MRYGIQVCAFVLAAGLLLNGDLSAGSLEPPGPPGPTMKTLQQVEARTPISSLPFTISQPGSYYSNGVIRNWGGRGISAINTAEVEVDRLRLDSNGSDGVRVGPRSTVRDTTSLGNLGNGISVETGSSVIECTATANFGNGILGATNSLVMNSTASSQTNGVGIALDTGGVATDCIAQFNVLGITVSARGRVARSVVRGNTTGIDVGDRVSIEDCTADANTDGISIQNNGLVRGNTASGNTSNGIVATNGNRIEENQVIANGVGIRAMGTNNLVVRNSAILNTSEYLVAGGNKLGPISADPATAGPWANFDQ